MGGTNLWRGPSCAATEYCGRPAIQLPLRFERELELAAALASNRSCRRALSSSSRPPWSSSSARRATSRSRRTRWRRTAGRAAGAGSSRASTARSSLRATSTWRTRAACRRRSGTRASSTSTERRLRSRLFATQKSTGDGWHPQAFLRACVTLRCVHVHVSRCTPAYIYMCMSGFRSSADPQGSNFRPE